MTLWRFDQGRLDYLQFDEIKRIALALAGINGIPKPNVDDDILRQVLSNYSPRPFAPANYTVWRRRPKGSVIIHSDQGSQLGSDEFSRWCKENRLSPSMSRRGNCWDNAVAESFFSNLKSEKIKKRIYQTRQEARSEVFEYIEVFYNPVRCHKHLDQLSPLEFERRQIAL